MHLMHLVDRPLRASCHILGSYISRNVCLTVSKARNLRAIAPLKVLGGMCPHNTTLVVTWHLDPPFL